MPAADLSVVDRLERLFAPLDRSDRPGAAIGVSMGGEVLFRHAFGRANMELPLPLASTMRMRIGSISKQFTALVFLLLCEEGLAELDAPISRYLPDLAPSCRDATPGQLLTHVSGIRDSIELALTFGSQGKNLSAPELAALYHYIQDFEGPPDACFRYNNAGYLLLALAIEAICARPLEEELQARIFEPLGMSSTRLRRHDRDFVENSAALHMTDSKGRYVKAHLGIASAGQGGIVSTVDDMLRWLHHMDQPIIGSETSWRLMRTPTILPDGSSSGYGAGLAINRLGSFEILSHAGAVLGGNAQMLKIPDLNFNLIVMANSQDQSAPALAQQILHCCYPDLDTPGPPASNAVQTGLFQSPTTKRLVEISSPEPRRVTVNGVPIPVHCAAPEFLSLGAGLSAGQQMIAFEADMAKKALLYQDRGEADRLLKLAPSPGSDLSAVFGDYAASSIAAQARVDLAGGLTTSGCFGSQRLQLQAINRNIWLACSPDLPWRMILTFDPERTRFWLATYRLGPILFCKKEESA